MIFQPSIKLLCLLILSHAFVFGQVAMNYKLTSGTEQDRSGLVGNGITDMMSFNNVVYAGTGFGLSITENNGATWQNYTPDDYGGKGGVSAMTIGEDGTLWIATAFDSTVEEGQSLSVGGGLRYLEEGSSEWGFIPQPIDARSDTMGGMSPTTTTVQNVTFDIAVRNSDELWISSFGGGVRRSLDRGLTWEVITTDGQPFSSLNFLNHRGFAALTEPDGTIWIGTVGGISRSIDGGVTWERFTPTNQNQPISGSWVIGLFHNPYDGSVWATTLRATEQSEFNGISRTKNDGGGWDIFLADELEDGTFPRYVAFYDSAIYVATEKGVYKSIDDGDNWFKLPIIRDTVTGEGLFTSTFYSVATTDATLPQHRLWVGSLDGLASTTNSGFDWTVFRSFRSTLGDNSDPRVYAYPNPFSPQHSDRICRFQFDIPGSSSVSIDIFNFAMERVISLRESFTSSGPADRSITWDATDSNGRRVDNGVYHFRAEVGDEVTWGKIVVIN